ncbi:MAG: FAD-dependent oxidoreductase [Chryseolinea sp.]
MREANINTFAPISHAITTTHQELPRLTKGASIIVAGAGAFGGWASLFLLRQGFKVTLVDPWGGGNSRSSSGDDSRVIRSTYGANKTYFDLNVRALQLWKEYETSFNSKVFHNTGVLWFCYESSTPLVDDSLAFADEHQMHYTYLSVDALAEQYPLLNTNDLHHAYFDPFGGFLKAREATMAVQSLFEKEGGTYKQQNVIPPGVHGPIDAVMLDNGEELRADLYLFACGSWLGKLFPDVLGEVITCTKQEVYYFGTPADSALTFDQIPVWVDVDGSDFYYGIPQNAGRGFKLGVDIRGELFDPTSGDRTITPDVFAKARSFLAHRFPGLANAPLLEHRTCPYESSIDGNFIFDVHPTAANVLFLGGGSGHGFKHGPALGELVAQILAGEKKCPDLFRLKR